jgi:hypothetical protein
LEELSQKQPEGLLFGGEFFLEMFRVSLISS